MVRPNYAASLATILVLMAGGTAQAQDRTFAMGRSGWVLEHFGTDVTVMRSATDPAASQAAAILLSCEGTVRRLRLTFPSDIAARTNVAGVMLVRKGDTRMPRDVGFGTPFVISGGRTLLISDSHARSEDVVAAFARMLAERPPAIEMLLHVGQLPISLRRLIPYRLSPFVSPDDHVLFLDFVNRCETVAKPGVR